MFPGFCSAILHSHCLTAQGGCSSSKGNVCSKRRKNGRGDRGHYQQLSLLSKNSSFPAVRPHRPRRSRRQHVVTRLPLDVRETRTQGAGIRLRTIQFITGNRAHLHDGSWGPRSRVFPPFLSHPASVSSDSVGTCSFRGRCHLRMWL